MEIKTIKEPVTKQIIIEKSKFITYLLPCNSKDEVLKLLSSLKEKHLDANHICYGYIINEDGTIYYKSSDDKEPANTAGMPILNVLRKSNLNNILCAVVRYFGGIILGAGGLTRAYSNSASNAINFANIVTLKTAFTYDLIFDYNLTKDVDKLIEQNNIKILKKDYNEQVTYTILFFDENKFLLIQNKYSYLPITFNKKEKILTSIDNDA